MLYDKRWDAKVEQPSLTGLIAWLEKQPGGTTYDFGDPYNCLVARYLQAIAHTPYCLSSWDVQKMFGYKGFEAVVKGPYTYKAALQRARSWWSPLCW